ncbi:hypothetical protein NUBL13938_51430 [Klebsiella pneumoniae]|nr:hypothetical protein NUBL13938_51430 [Klebsiella pneumoniae]
MRKQKYNNRGCYMIDPTKTMNENIKLNEQSIKEALSFLLQKKEKKNEGYK